MPTYTSLSASTSTDTGTTTEFWRVPGVVCHVYSAAGSSATVLIQGSVDGSVWYTLATVTNPSATGELWQGTALPYHRAKVSARSSGTITAVFADLAADPGDWSSAVAAQSTSAPTFGLIKRSVTNAEIVAAGTGGTTADLTVGTLPANSIVKDAYLIVGTQATFAAGTLTMSVGVTATGYTDWLGNASLKAAAATVYGDAAAERGTDLGILFYSTAQTIKAHVIAGAGDLANVTTCTGTIYVHYVTLP